MTQLIADSQGYLRDAEGDLAVVSLRDVKRVLDLIRFFVHALSPRDADASQIKWAVRGYKTSLCLPITLALAHVYFFRLPSSNLRIGLWNCLRSTLRILTDGGDTDKLPGPYVKLLTPGGFEGLLDTAKHRFCKRFALEPGIAMNAALMENLYVVVIAILNRMPIFLVGKPGSSKTLAMQVIVSNLQGEQSPRPFWRHFPALHLFSFQCSPMTQANGILEQFRMACNYQQHAQKTRTVLLLDEVGLAEHSPDMPLKVLHGILVDPPISVVGISNWTLDAAKMNRAICLQRPEPREGDLQLTGESIINLDGLLSAPTPVGDEDETVNQDAGPPRVPALQRTASYAQQHLSSVLSPLAAAYHAVYTQQPGGRDFIGMRDYYCTLKMLRNAIASSVRVGQAHLRPKVLLWALCRNFGGRNDILDLTLKTFLDRCYGKKTFSIIVISATEDGEQKAADARRDLVSRQKDLFAELDLLERAHQQEISGKERQLPKYAEIKLPKYNQAKKDAINEELDALSHRISAAEDEMKSAAAVQRVCGHYKEVGPDANPRLYQENFDKSIGTPNPVAKKEGKFSKAAFQCEENPDLWLSVNKKGFWMVQTKEAFKNGDNRGLLFSPERNMEVNG